MAHSVSSSPLPDFLVIGAMKAGTTTLYHDLRTHSGLLLPDKESNALLAEDPEARFRQLFRGVRPDQKKGEICPDYTKPDLDEIAARNAATGYEKANRPPPRILYLVRHPISRIRSHHHFLSSQHGDANPGGMTEDIEAALRDFPELIDTSRYHARLQPWIQAFGRDAIQVIVFEDYIANRSGILQSIAEFLGLESFEAGAIQADRIHNASDARPVATAGWRRIMKHPLYRRLVRPLLPLPLRDRLRHGLLPSSPPRPAPPSPETQRYLVETLSPDLNALTRLLNLDAPPWDLEAALESEAS